MPAPHASSATPPGRSASLTLLSSRQHHWTHAAPASTRKQSGSTSSVQTKAAGGAMRPPGPGLMDPIPVRILSREPPPSRHGRPRTFWFEGAPNLETCRVDPGPLQDERSARSNTEIRERCRSFAAPPAENPAIEIDLTVFHCSRRERPGRGMDFREFLGVAIKPRVRMPDW